MNYRHAYHAGNFADVFKHIILTRVIEYLKRKDGAFRVYDTHAGTGIYDLASPETARTGEWISGIGRLIEVQPGNELADLIGPYLEIVANYRDGDLLTAYPGSPMIARKLLRKQDRLSLYELHPEDSKKLAAEFAGDYQVRVNQLDGWLVPGAHLPPKEKRGMVLIDPPFEEKGDFGRLATAFEKSHRRWPGGTILAWYPLKHQKAVSGFVDGLKKSNIEKLLRIEFWLEPERTEVKFRGCGLIIKNPPYTLAGELKVILPFLCENLGTGEAGFRVEQLTDE
ncbi:MAG: 23S rRNA (adenine(2030)-N(6))-methyltransferase RlmJ [Rhizobiaceae bacterium]